MFGPHGDVVGLVLLQPVGPDVERQSATRAIMRC